MAYSEVVSALNALSRNISDPYQLQTAYQTIAAGNDNLTVSATAPADPEVNELWYDTTTNVLSYWNSFDWMDHAVFNSMEIRNIETDAAAIDFSENVAFGEIAFKFKTNCPNSNSYVTFGTTDDSFEYVWDSDTDEEFIWRYPEGDAVTISKTGITTKNLIVSVSGSYTDVVASLNQTAQQISSLLTTSAANQARITQLEGDANTYATKFELSQAVVVYSDGAPTGTIPNGALWFDSMNLRLNVRHGGVWVYPDRVEDTALKASLLNAVNTSTDYATLKANLIAALS